MLGRNVVQFAISLAIGGDPPYKFESLRAGLPGRGKLQGSIRRAELT